MSVPKIFREGNQWWIVSTAGTGLFEIRSIVMFDCDFTEYNLLFVSFAIINPLGFIAPLIYL